MVMIATAMIYIIHNTKDSDSLNVTMKMLAVLTEAVVVLVLLNLLITRSPHQDDQSHDRKQICIWGVCLCGEALHLHSCTFLGDASEIRSVGLWGPGSRASKLRMGRQACHEVSSVGERHLASHARRACRMLVSHCGGLLYCCARGCRQPGTRFGTFDLGHFLLYGTCCAVASSTASKQFQMYR